MEERPTKKQMKEQRKLERLAQMEEEKSSSNVMKWVVLGIVGILFLAAFSYAIIFSKQNKPGINGAVVLSSEGQKTGTSSASVTLVEFGDFQCPACKSYEPALKKVRAEYKDKIQFIFKHFPLKSIHKNALPAAIAAEAAAKQGKFWQYHDLLYERQEAWSGLADPRATFVDYASELDLDVDQFAKDLKDKALEVRVNAQVDEGTKAGVNATPTFYLNGKYLDVRSDFDSFKKAIDAALATNKK